MCRAGPTVPKDRGRDEQQARVRRHRRLIMCVGHRLDLVEQESDDVPFAAPDVVTRREIDGLKNKRFQTVRYFKDSANPRILVWRARQL